MPSNNTNIKQDDLKQTEVKFEAILSDVTSIINILGIGADSFVSKLLNGMSQAISLAQSIASIISSIINIASGGFLSFLGFASGGYTGDGNQNEPAGIVHKGEFVINKEKTKQFYPLLQLIHGNASPSNFSFSSGGFAPNPVPSQPITIQLSGEMSEMQSVRVVSRGLIGAQARIEKRAVGRK